MITILKDKIIKGFTLIELVLVLVIMGSLLLITMQFGLRGMDELQVHYDQEAITQLLFSVVSATQQSNILQGKPYTYLDINFSQRGINVSNNNNSITHTLELKQAELGFSRENLQLRIRPYTLGCEVLQGDPTTLFLQFKNKKISCFQLDLGTCKAIVKSCGNEK